MGKRRAEHNRSDGQKLKLTDRARALAGKLQFREAKSLIELTLTSASTDAPSLKRLMKLAAVVDKTLASAGKLHLKDNRENVELAVAEVLTQAKDPSALSTVDDLIAKLKAAVKDARSKDNRYNLIIERIFLDHYTSGVMHVDFDRDELRTVGEQLGIRVPKNLGDIVYSFRYRGSMPSKVQEKAAAGNVWIIRGAGRAKYRFVQMSESLAFVFPTEGAVETKIPDSTPGIIAKYALSDEQALLAKLRYNRLIDIFTGAACYSLQNHLRTAVPELGQIETDELYVGVDKKGTHYVFPVQAKGGRDTLNIVQVEQDVRLCKLKFPSLVCRPIAAQFKDVDLIVLIEFEDDGESARRASEKHYRLVPGDQVTLDDLSLYRSRLE